MEADRSARGRRPPAALELSPLAGRIVLQPTPLCNLRCAYCYLTNLNDSSRMSPALPQRLAAELAGYPPDHQVEICWHAGEPLTVGVEHLSRLLEPFEPLRIEGRLRHSLQTNGTLVTQEWAETLNRYDVGVGVSIDGPRWANRQRRTLSGAETFERAMAGIACLREHRVPFSTIAVVTLDNIPAIIDRADGYLAFFRSIGSSEIGLNIEEQEGHHTIRPSNRGQVTDFWQAIFDAWLRADGQPRIRDFHRVLSFAQSTLEGTARPRPVDPIPTVTFDGNVVLLSPELAGYHDARYDDFIVGNLYQTPLTDAVARGLTSTYVREFLQGAEGCRATCRYFAYCRAGSASNRYFEFGDFAVSETQYCRNSRQAPFDVVVGISQLNQTDQLPV